MEINYLDFIFYIIILVIAWIVFPEESKKELGIIRWVLFCIIFTIVWIIIFVWPIDLNISSVFNINWNIKMKP